MEPIKWSRIRHKAGPFFFKDFPDGLIAHLGMGMCLGPGQNTIFKPGIQFSQGFELWSRYEEPASEHTNLVLNLSSASLLEPMALRPSISQPEAGVQATGSTR